MSKSCWSISWDHQYRVYAVYLRMTFGGDLELLSCCCDTSGQRTLGDRLNSILEKIQVGEEDYLVLGGYMPECVIVERYFPPLEGRELEEAITFSSESCFPVARKKLKFTYNVLEKRRDGQQRVRIMAVLDKQLDKIFWEMRKANVKADMLWHPFMAIGTELDNQEIFLPFIEPDCILEPAGGDGLRRVTIVAGYASAPPLTHLADLAPRLKLKDCEQPISGAYPSAVLLGAAMLRNSGRKNWRKPLLPPDLHRQRFRRFRHNILYMSVVCFMLLIALIGKIWYQERDMIVETNARILETQTMLEKVAKERETMARRQAVLQKFCENLNSDREALNFLFRLTSLLPDNMYVTSFASTGNRISATIIYTGERIALFERLATLQGYRLAEDTKTTQNADNKSSTAQVVWNKDTDLK